MHIKTTVRFEIQTLFTGQWQRLSTGTVGGSPYDKFLLRIKRNVLIAFEQETTQEAVVKKKKL